MSVGKGKELDAGSVCFVLGKPSKYTFVKLWQHRNLIRYRGVVVFSAGMKKRP